LTAEDINRFGRKTPTVVLERAFRVRNASAWWGHNDDSSTVIRIVYYDAFFPNHRKKKTIDIIDGQPKVVGSSWNLDRRNSKSGADSVEKHSKSQNTAGPLLVYVPELILKHSRVNISGRSDHNMKPQGFSVAVLPYDYGRGRLNR